MGIENDMLYIREGRFVEEMIGWQDYNDLATKTTPVVLTNANQYYELPNDGAGPFTNTKYRVLGKPEVWNTETNSFNFSELFLGGIMWFRFNILVTAPTANTEVYGRIRAAVGTPSEYTVPIGGRYMKRNNFQYQLGATFMMTMDNEETIKNPAKVELAADVGGASVVVDGWKIVTLDRF